MKKRAILLGLAVCVAASMSPVSAATCGYPEIEEVVPKTMAADGATADTVDPYTANRYTVTLTPGAHFIFLVTAGDADLRVCQGTTMVCDSYNPLAPDACFAEDTGDLGGVGIGVGNPVNGPGTFKILVKHCTSEACNYPQAGDPAPEVLDAPLAYALVIV